jgi:hypothetical protein
MAPPTPWKTRQEISIVAEFAIPEKRDESVRITMPQREDNYATGENLPPAIYVCYSAEGNKKSCRRQEVGGSNPT